MTQTLKRHYLNFNAKNTFKTFETYKIKVNFATFWRENSNVVHKLKIVNETILGCFDPLCKL